MCREEMGQTTHMPSTSVANCSKNAWFPSPQGKGQGWGSLYPTVERLNSSRELSLRSLIDKRKTTPGPSFARRGTGFFEVFRRDIEDVDNNEPREGWKQDGYFPGVWAIR